MSIETSDSVSFKEILIKERRHVAAQVKLRNKLARQVAKSGEWLAPSTLAHLLADDMFPEVLDSLRELTEKYQGKGSRNPLYLLPGRPMNTLAREWL